MDKLIYKGKQYELIEIMSPEFVYAISPDERWFQNEYDDIGAITTDFPRYGIIRCKSLNINGKFYALKRIYGKTENRKGRH